MAKRPKHKNYSIEEIAAGQRAVELNGGYVLPTAKVLGVRHKTLSQWANDETNKAAEARRLNLSNNEDESLAKRWLDIVLAAQETMMEKLPAANAQQAAIVGGVAFDKRQMTMGRPTSASLQVIRYVPADSLHKLAAKRMKALGSGRSEPRPQGARPKVVAAQDEPALDVSFSDITGTADS